MTDDMFDSFHAHIYFSPGEQAQRAARLLENIKAQLGDRVQVGRWHDKPVGPHPRGSYQLHVDAAHSSVVLDWLMRHRDGLTVFMHGNSGDDLADHTDHVVWLGESEALNLSMFRKRPA